MKNLKNKTTSGISLVALIVTIIVLIILTAAVIVTFMEGGIIEKAKEAVFKSDIRTYQEILAVKNAEKQIELATGNGEGGLYNETEYEKIKEIIPEFKEEYKDLIAIANGEIVLGTRTDDPYSTWLSELGIGAGKNAIPENSVVTKLQVGHYVNYNIPEGERKEYNEEVNKKDNRFLLLPIGILLVVSIMYGLGSEAVYTYVSDAVEVLMNPSEYIQAVLKEW